MAFDGLHMSLGSISRLSDAVSRSISAENVYGEKGNGGMAEVSDKPQPEVVKIGQKWDGPNSCARDLGRPWKVRPCITLPAASTTTLMDIDGPGCIQHIWITVDWTKAWNLVVRMYWDNEKEPSVEAPLNYLFCNAYQPAADIMALPINVNPTNGCNSYFPMPFRSHARITVENLSGDAIEGFFYTVNYALTQVGDDEAYFHARYRRTNPLKYLDDYTILDDVRGKGHYVGTYMAWQQNSKGWWGEGEIKMFLDGDTEYPTICGTGTEDYFGGAWCFGRNYSAPFLGYPSGRTDNETGGRHSLYRFHIMDPVRFETDLKVTMQAIGWRSEWRYLPLQDDISSVAYWYQAEPHNPFPSFPTRDEIEIV
ncbi:MAG: DUF2961 domain-containing protein [Chitinivibrionales bacterium]|nr:DUF2961 domain-containing protein [Chitinivibrionales bacterium]